MKKLPTLYKLDSKGKTREWNIIVDADSFWTEAGIVGMKMNTAKPTICKGKNIGRSNETSPEQQAEAEAQAKWDKKRKDGYCQNIEDVSTKKFYEPMLAHDYAKYSGQLRFPLHCQPKLDGIRCIIRLEDNEVVARTRKGRLVETIPHILQDLRGFFQQYPETILDGELYNHEYRNNFNTIVSLVRKQKPIKSSSDTDKTFNKKSFEWEKALKRSKKSVQYWIYDCPRVDFLKENHFFTVRLAHLKHYFSFVYSKYIRLVETAEIFSQKSLDETYGYYLDKEFEGQMIRLDEGYEQKRSKHLLKRKEFQDKEYKVIDIEEGNGNRQGTAKHLVCYCPDTKQTFHSNIKGTFEYLKEILQNKDDYIGKFATIKFFELTPDGVPRFPYAIAFRDYE